MRARHRHFNYAALGASAVFDARFLALNNDDAVSTWTDRSSSANNATQTGSERPVFKTNQINGQPGVAFTSAGQSSLILTSAIAVANASETLLVQKKTSNNLIALSTDVGGQGAIITDYSTSQFLVLGADGSGGYANSSTTNPALWMVSPNNLILLDGVSQGFNPFSGSGSNATRIGRRSTEYSSGQIGLIAYFGSGLTAASRKRAQHHAAFSYKIACS